jgi:uncharacterized membrane protein YjfL (UPF0719 family)
MMDFDFAGASGVMLLLNLVYAVVALFVGVLGIRVVDRIFLRRIDLEDEIRKGNIAAAIFASALLLFVGIVVSQALGQ